jgi:hypothetical protein
MLMLAYFYNVFIHFQEKRAMIKKIQTTYHQSTWVTQVKTPPMEVYAMPDISG